MGQKSTWLAQQMADFYLGNGPAPTPPASFYYIASTAGFDINAVGTACDEVGGGLGYARVEVVNDATEWPAATGGNPWEKANASLANFGTATSNWGTIAAVYLADDPVAGNIWFGIDVTPTSIVTGSGAHVPPGGFVLDEY